MVTALHLAFACLATWGAALVWQAPCCHECCYSITNSQLHFLQAHTCTTECPIITQPCTPLPRQ